VLRPIDSNLSIFTAEQRANQIRDPSAHHVQTLQQDEIAKKTQHEAQSVQPADKTDEDMKVKDRKDGRKEEERRNKKRRKFPDEPEKPEDESETAAASDASKGRFNFLA
jgi:hypothetical protein